jgi:hypothetical protein
MPSGTPTVPVASPPSVMHIANVDDKDLRRRGVELDMAHKAHDRAKGQIHGRKGRAVCTMCNGGHPRVSRGAPALSHDEVERAERDARDEYFSQLARSAFGGDANTADEWSTGSSEEDQDDAGSAHRCSERCDHILGARVVVKSLKKRKGEAMMSDKRLQLLSWSNHRSWC